MVADDWPQRKIDGHRSQSLARRKTRAECEPWALGAEMTKVYRTYIFRSHDPILDELRGVVLDSGLEQAAHAPPAVCDHQRGRARLRRGRHQVRGRQAGAQRARTASAIESHRREMMSIVDNMRRKAANWPSPHVRRITPFIDLVMSGLDKLGIEPWQSSARQIEFDYNGKRYRVG